MNLLNQPVDTGPTPAWIRNDHHMIVRLTSGVASGYIMTHIEVKPEEIVDLAVRIGWEIHKREQGMP